MEQLVFWRDDGGHVTDTEWRAAWLRALGVRGWLGQPVRPPVLCGAPPLRRRRIERYRSHDLRHVGLTYAAKKSRPTVGTT